MANLPLVKSTEPLQDLGRNYLSPRPGLGRMRLQILAEITMQVVLHRDMDGRWVVVPAQKGNEEIAMLFRSAAGFIPSPRRRTYML